jgi:uncharacterized membrane protein
MLSATDIQNLTALVAAVATLVGVVTLLIKQMQQGTQLAEVHYNTNSALEQLRSTNTALQAQQATAVELSVRPPMPDAPHPDPGYTGGPGDMAPPTHPGPRASYPQQER